MLKLNTSISQSFHSVSWISSSETADFSGFSQDQQLQRPRKAAMKISSPSGMRCSRMKKSRRSGALVRWLRPALIFFPKMKRSEKRCVMDFYGTYAEVVWSRHIRYISLTWYHYDYNECHVSTRIKDVSYTEKPPDIWEKSGGWTSKMFLEVWSRSVDLENGIDFPT